MKLVILSLMLAMTSVFAMGGKGEGHKRAEEFKKELNLTDEQVEKFREHHKGRKEMKDLKARFKESKKAFHRAMGNTKSSTEELNAKFEAFLKLREEMHRKRFAHMLEMRKILNPEQLEKFHELLSKKHKWKKRKDD